MHQNKRVGRVFQRVPFGANDEFGIIRLDNVERSRAIFPKELGLEDEPTHYRAGFKHPMGMDGFP